MYSMGVVLSDRYRKSMTEDIHALLHGAIWHIPRGYHLRGPRTRILCAPHPTDDVALFDVSLTIQRARQQASDLAGLTMVLYGVDDQALIHYGRLDQRGQILFRRVQAGAYRPYCTEVGCAASLAWSVPPAPPLRDHLARLLIATPALPYRPVATGAHTEHAWTCQYQNASGTLAATIHAPTPEGGTLDIEAHGREWDGALAGFLWLPRAAADDPPTAQLLFAPLRWSTTANACTAHLRLGALPPSFSLALPDQPWPFQMLTPDLEPMLRQSIMQSATAHTHRAWHSLAQSISALPPNVRALLAALVQS